MKQGRTLSELAAEIDRQAQTKRDFIASTASMVMAARTEDEKHYHHELLIPGRGGFAVNAHAHAQIGAHLDIPRKYYDKMMAEQPGLLSHNVNTWFAKERNTTRRMVRTLDGKARAFLSDRFQAIDNDVVAETALTVLTEVAPTMKISSCELTDSRLYIKATFPEIQREVKKGDIVCSGVSISNSEIGMGAVEVVPWSERLVCLNGMKHTEYGQRRNHVGRLVEGENGSEIFASDTLRADAKAFLMKLRDVIRATVDPKQFELIVSKMAEAAGQMVEGNPAGTVEVLAKKYSLNETEKGGVLRHLIQGGDLSRWGVANAVTRQAADVVDYDRASELEALGGRVIELTPKDWRELALAA